MMRKTLIGVLVFILVFGLVSYTAFAFSPPGLQKKGVEADSIHARGIPVPPGLEKKGGLPPGIQKKIGNPPPGFEKKDDNLPPGIRMRFGLPGSSSTDSTEIKEVKFIRLTWGELPNEVKQWVEDNQYFFRGRTLIYDEELYILASYGKKPTGGYQVTIDSITVKENKDEKFLEVAVELINPEDEDSVITAITYPYDLVVIEKEYEEVFDYPVRFVFAKVKK